MDIQKIFPFYDSAPIINREINDRFDLTDLKYLKTMDLPRVILSRELIEEIWKYYGNSRIDIIHLIPNDIYFYSGRDEILKILMNYYYEDSKKIPVMITNVDYKSIADNLTLINSRVLKSQGNGYEVVTDLITNKFIEDSKLERNSNSSILSNLVLKENFKERRKARLYFPVIENFDKNQEIESNNISFISQIESYLRSDDITEQIPMLIGLSGIAKSAIVKSITEKLDRDETYLKNNPYGMRLVDFRVAFMSALDINGMFNQYEYSDKTINTRVSPTIEFFSCTDEYLKFARRMVKLIESKLFNPLTLTNRDKVELEQLLNKFKYESKTPVFFFDEITRSSQDIQGALSIIVNQRLYQQYHLNEARMIAATNLPYMNKKFNSKKEREQFESKLANIFIKTNIKDVALVDKFKRIKISPEDVRPSWFSWAESNIDFSVLTFLKNNPDLLYDVSPIIESSDENLLIRKVIPAYPNYRTWENISDYIKYIKSNHRKDLNKLIISGLIGESTANKFLEYFIVNYPDIKIKEDVSLDTLVEDTLNANLPLMLVGVPGIGKTSRIKDYCDKYGFDRLVISLATMDRTELMGAATQRDFITQIGGKTSDILNRLNLIEEVNQIKELITDFPDNLTVRSPRYDLVQRVKKSVDYNQILVLVFDEANRSIDPITQSVIFKAISDNEIFGIKFPKDRIRIVVIGNLSGGTTSGAKAFDSALYARCVSYVQYDYSLEDVSSLLKYIKTKKYSKILIDFIEKKLPNSEEYVLDWLKSIDKASLLNNVPTSRSLKTLSDILKRPPNPQGDQLYGSVISIEEFQSDIDRFISDNNPDYDLTLRLAIRVKEIISTNWAGIKNYKFYQNKKSKFEYLLTNDNSDRDAIKIFNEFIFNNLLLIKNNYQNKSSDEFKKFNEAVLWIKRFLEIDRDIINYRRRIFEDIAGREFTDLFLPYYNEVSGSEDIDLSITSILNPLLIPRYLESEMNYCYQNGTYKWSKIIELVLKELGKTYSDENYLKLLNHCIDFDLNATGGAVENSRQELKELLSNKDLEGLILRLEFKPSKEYYQLINKLRYSREDYDRVSGNSFIGKAIYL